MAYLGRQIITASHIVQDVAQQLEIMFSALVDVVDPVIVFHESTDGAVFRRVLPVMMQANHGFKCLLHPERLSLQHDAFPSR